MSKRRDLAGRRLAATLSCCQRKLGQFARGHQVFFKIIGSCRALTWLLARSLTLKHNASTRTSISERCDGDRAEGIVINFRYANSSDPESRSQFACLCLVDDTTWRGSRWQSGQLNLVIMIFMKLVWLANWQWRDLRNKERKRAVDRWDRQCDSSGPSG